MNRLKSGAIDFDVISATADGLRTLVFGSAYVPIRKVFWPHRFPMFRASRYSLTEDHGYIINVWRIRDEVEKFHVIGGGETNTDKGAGYISTYQHLLNGVIYSEEQSRHVFSILDHVISDSLMNHG